MAVKGADSAIRRLSRLSRAVKEEVDAANEKSGKELIGLARVLIPKRSGESVAQIKGERLDDGAYLCDFGPKSKVIEGDRGPRAFVNPALKVTRKKFKARNKRALNKAVKKARHG